MGRTLDTVLYTSQKEINIAHYNKFFKALKLFFVNQIIFKMSK